MLLPLHYVLETTFIACKGCGQHTTSSRLFASYPGSHRNSYRYAPIGLDEPLYDRPLKENRTTHVTPWCVGCIAGVARAPIPDLKARVNWLGGEKQEELPVGTPILDLEDLGL